MPMSVGQVAPDERLAARDPQLLDAELDERPRRALDLLEASGPGRVGRNA